MSALQDTASELQPPPTRGARLLMVVLWPAFVMAGVMEALVFALVDPADLRWAAGMHLDMPNAAVYTIAFLLFWSIISIAAGIAALLASTPPAESLRD
ncbi:hypothetical protein [Roseateles sp.]|jgi:hypothetical protein|uniref:hypothetical protein n=1 Tax=Roseateles sp. TaxID=1971397 RepID=UPI0037C9AC9F